MNIRDISEPTLPGSFVICSLNVFRFKMSFYVLLWLLVVFSIRRDDIIILVSVKNILYPFVFIKV